MQEQEINLPPEVMHLIMKEVLVASIRKQKMLKRNRTFSIIVGSCFTAIALIASTANTFTQEARLIDAIASIIGVCATWVASNNYKMLLEQETINQRGIQHWKNSN